MERYIARAIRIVEEDLREYLLEVTGPLEMEGNILEEIDELNRILSKEEIEWKDFEIILRTKKKLITILIASLNSRYARPLNDLLNRITELFNQKLDERFAKEHGIDLGDLKRMRTFHWIFEFPEVFLDREGFDIVIGNPPYGFRETLTSKDKELFRKMLQSSFPSGDIAELFVKRGLELTVALKGRFSFIIPKKSIYGESWYQIRQLFREYHSSFFIDAGRAFEDVKLEMIIFCVINEKRRNNYIKVGYFNKDKSSIEELGHMDDLNDLQSPFYIYCVGVNKKIYETIAKFPRLSEFGVNIKIGQSNITGYMQENKSDEKDVPILKGKDISRYAIRSVRYLPEKYVEPEYLRPKLIFQKIIAHIERPIPHIELMGCLDKHGIFTIPDTSVSYTADKISLEALLAILNSKFVSWFFYNFAYDRAIRTMDFIDYYADQLPIPERVYSADAAFREIVDYLLILNQTKAEDSLIDMLDKEIIDSLVYELYFKEKFAEDGLYPEAKEYLLEAVSKHLKPVSYDRWAELYWKKQLEGSLSHEEERELEALEREILETINEVYNLLASDEQVHQWVERIGSHEWVKTIEGAE